MYLCKFGQNSFTDFENNARKPYFGHFIVPVWPWKLGQGHQILITFFSSKQCICASSVKIHQLVKKIMYRNPILDISRKISFTDADPDADPSTDADGIRTKNNMFTPSQTFGPRDISTHTGIVLRHCKITKWCLT